MTTKSISVVLSAVTGPYQAAMAKAAATTRGFSAATSGAASSVGNVATSTGLLNPKLIGGAGLVYGLKSTTDAAIAWESAFTGVRKTVEGTPEQLEGIADGLRQMSKEIPTTAVELAGIAEAAGQLGIETDSILGFTQVIADLGETTNLTGEQAATSLARFANITGMAEEDFDRLGSTIVQLGNNSATTEAEIVEMAMRIAGAGSQIGMSEGEILGWSAALSSAGINAEAGGSAISKVMIDIASEVENGGDKLETFASVAGMSVADFSKAFREDASGAMQAFVDGLGRMEESGGSTLGTLEDLEITEVRMRDALLRLSGAGDLVADSLDLQQEGWEENNALQREAALRYGTTEAKLDRINNAFTDIKTTIGTGLIPAMESAMGTAEQLIAALEFELPGGGSLLQTLTEGAAGNNPLAGLIPDIENAAGMSLRDIPNPLALPGQQVGRIKDAWNEWRNGTEEAVEPTYRIARSIANVDESLGTLLFGTGEQLFSWLQQGAERSVEMAEGQGEMAMFVKDANDELQHQISLFQELSAGPVDNLISALENVEEAQSAYDEALAGTVGTADDAMFETQAEKTAALEDATWDLYLANLNASEAADLAAGKYGDVEASMIGMYDAGLISNDQLETLLGLLDDTRQAAESWERTYMMILDADLSPMQRKLNNLRNQGFHVAIPGIAGAGGITMHSGGVVGGDAGRMPGLASDERLRVLQVGERVIPASQVASGESRGSQSVGTQVEVGGIHLTVADANEGLRAANREQRMMALGYR